MLSPDQQMEELKAAGNEEFSRGQLDRALQCYTDALNVPNSDSSSHQSKARIYGNRSLINGKLGNLEASLLDANHCVSLDKNWPKGYYRLGMAFDNMQQHSEAMMAFELGLAFLSDGDGDKKLEQEFNKKIKALQQNQDDAQNVVKLEEVRRATVTADTLAVTLDRQKVSDDCEGGVGNIYVRSLSEGIDNRGVFAKKRIPAKRVILAVPRAMMLTLQVARQESSICRKLDSAVRSQALRLLSPNHCFFAVFMLGDTGRFRDYCDSLPRDLSCMPVFWSSDELTLLRGSHFLQKIEDKKMSILRDYDEIVRVVPEFFELATIEAFTAKRMLVNSRVFATEIDGVETMAMVPLVDMLNHKRPPQTEWYFDNNTQSFLLASTQLIAAHDELFDSYGAKCNSRYLLNYGFTSPDNRDADGTCYNEFSFKLSLDIQDPTYKIKERMMTSRDEGFSTDPCTSWRLNLSMHFETESNLNSFCFARFIFASPREMTHLPRRLPSRGEGFSYPSDGSRGNIVMPISVANETAVLQCFKEKAAYQLSLFDTSLEEDYERRPQLVPLSNEWNACNLLIGEKEVCHYVLDLCDDCCRMFAMNYQQATEYVQSRKKQHIMNSEANAVENEIVDYLEKICLPLMKRER